MNNRAEQVLFGIKERLPLAGRTIAELRASFESLCLAYSSGLDLVKERLAVGNFDAHWIYPPGTPSGPVILFFHGGAFMMGSTSGHNEIIGRLSIESGVRVLSADYRLAPEHPYPVPGNDCFDAYIWLTENGYSPDRIVLAGDSAGGTLVLGTLIRLRDAGLEMPAGACCMSPATDHNYKHGSIERNMHTDWLPMDVCQGVKLLYLAGADPDLPEVSPALADLAGLPPLFIQAGSHEILLDDSLTFAEKARKAGVDVTLEVWEGMYHCWQFFSSMLPQGQEAIESAGRFIRRLFEGCAR